MVSVVLILAKIWKTTFSKKMFNQIGLSVEEDRWNTFLK